MQAFLILFMFTFIYFMMFIIFGHLFGITGLKKKKILYKNVSNRVTRRSYLRPAE